MQLLDSRPSQHAYCLKNNAQGAFQTFFVSPVGLPAAMEYCSIFPFSMHSLVSLLNTYKECWWFVI